MTEPQSAGPRPRRRAERPSDAQDIDRSWDAPDAMRQFGDDPVGDPREADQAPVEIDEGPEVVPDNAELDESFWKDQQPPHFGA